MPRLTEAEQKAHLAVIERKERQLPILEAKRVAAESAGETKWAALLVQIIETTRTRLDALKAQDVQTEKPARRARGW